MLLRNMLSAVFYGHAWSRLDVYVLDPSRLEQDRTAFLHGVGKQ